MNVMLAEAVRQHRVITFRYEDLLRTVEPYLYGVHAETDNEILSAFQIGGFSHSSDQPGWRYFLVSDIHGLNATDQLFAARRPDYNPNDSRFKTIYARA